MSESYSIFNYDIAYADQTYPKWAHKEVHQAQVDHIQKLGQTSKTIWCQEKLDHVDDGNVPSSASANELSFQCSYQNGVRIGTIQLYGKTMQGEDTRLDVPQLLSFLWRFPKSFTQEQCFAVWKAIKNKTRKVTKAKYKSGNEIETNEYTLSSCVYYAQFVQAADAQRFDFHQKHPYLRLVFLTKRDFMYAQAWFNQFQLPNQEERMLTREYLQLPDNIMTTPEFKLLLFETSIKFDCAWNREWGNPNGWFNVASSNYFRYDSETHQCTTTCDIYVFINHPNKIVFDPNRSDVPPFKVGVWDLETKGLYALADPQAQLLTSTLAVYEFGGVDSQTKLIKEAHLLAIDVVTWQPSLPVTGCNMFVEESEESALIQVVEGFRRHKLDYLVTYNGINFDIVFLLQRIQKLDLREVMSLGKDMKQQSFVKQKGDGGDYMGASHSGMIHIDLLVFYKTFHSSLKSKALKEVLNHFYDNEEDEDLQETLVKERDSVSHSSSLMRDFCSVLDQKILINSKQDVHFMEIPPMFFSSNPQIVRDLLEYNVTDVFQTARLAITHDVLFITMAFSKVFEITGNVYYSQGAEIRCMSRLWRNIFEQGLVYNVYQFPDDDPYLYSTFQAGATVQDPKVGAHQAAYILDVASEYPSMIMEYFLCKSTLIEERFLSVDQRKELDDNWIYRRYDVQGHIILVIDGKKTSTKEELAKPPYYANIEISLKAERKRYKDLVKQAKERGEAMAQKINGANEAAVKVLMNAMYGLNGQQGTTIWALADMKNQSIEELQERLAMYQKVIKKDLQKKGQEKTLKLYQSAAQIVEQMIRFFRLREDELRKTPYDISETFRQLDRAFQTKAQEERRVHKLIMRTRNSGGYWPFYILGALICFLAREYIETSKQLVLTNYPGVKIVGGDTDSLFPDATEYLTKKGYSRLVNEYEFEVALYRLGKEQEHLVNEYWKVRGCKRGYLIFELETIFRIFVNGDKKKWYFAWKLNVTEDKKTGHITIEEGKIKVTGLECKRRHIAQKLRDMISYIIDLVAHSRIEEAFEKTRLDIIQMVQHKVPIDLLVMYNTLNNDPKEMTSISACAKVALDNEKAGRGMARRKEEVSYVYVTCPGKNKNALKTTEIVLDYKEAKRTGVPLNYAYYLERHFRNPIVYIWRVIKPELDMEKVYDQWITSAQNHNIGSLFQNIKKRKIQAELDRDQDKDSAHLSKRAAVENVIVPMIEETSEDNTN